MNKLPLIFLTISASFIFSIDAYSQDSKKKNLSVITSLSVHGKEKELDNDTILKNYLHIEPVTKAEFLSNQKTAINFVVVDSPGIKKKKGRISLPIKSGTRVFIDKSHTEENRQEYSYLGEISFLNVYVIGCNYSESADYKFISKLNGAELQNFSAFPYISPNKQHIIAIYTDPYETDADLEFYQIVNGKPENIIRASFKNWMPASEKVNMFWGSDGNLYVPVLAPEKFWKPNGQLNNQYEYIRISIL
jgi:hypothetical protein